MTINCDMNCTRKCPAYNEFSVDCKCKLVSAELAKLNAERKYYESMTS